MKIIWVLFIIVFVGNFLLALTFGNTSIKKGYSGYVTGILTLFFGIPGMLYAIALPDRIDNNEENRFQKLVLVLSVMCFVQILATTMLFNVVLDNVSDVIVDAREQSQITEDQIEDIQFIINELDK